MVYRNEKETQKTDSSILERFSSEELWILFVEKKCQECDLPEDKCNNLKARKCFNDWLQNCDE